MSLQTFHKTHGSGSLEGLEARKLVSDVIVALLTENINLLLWP
jgi:hypothetical protein